ncbi:hypothetical protein P691DRAFT_397337 [Macrolepiota fuliginosa MF-IS2]|uniref:Uncharacterized protein n=1 Tax=Macrolepiota fuliginosa MF-IS2 TaxID=1400762 RepID=A0A9P5XN42_9AGAR|nr:hypothetical protein P691DRAFT_397337 [Macrolepiota fuliginosa MF-IS2]
MRILHARSSCSMASFSVRTKIRLVQFHGGQNTGWFGFTGLIYAPFSNTSAHRLYLLEISLARVSHGIVYWFSVLVPCISCRGKLCVYAEITLT